ncbi:hypothetical protein D3C87_649860 [compost metagenome]
MTPTGLSETQLVDLISGRIQDALQQMQGRMSDSESLPDVLPELGQAIAKGVAAAIHANNVTCAEQAERSLANKRLSTAEYYDHLSACVDGY